MWHLFDGCIWDIPALILVVAVTLGIIWQRYRYKKRREDLEEL